MSDEIQTAGDGYDALSYALELAGDDVQAISDVVFEDDNPDISTLSEAAVGNTITLLKERIRHIDGQLNDPDFDMGSDWRKRAKTAQHYIRQTLVLFEREHGRRRNLFNNPVMRIKYELFVKAFTVIEGKNRAHQMWERTKEMFPDAPCWGGKPSISADTRRRILDEYESGKSGYRSIATRYGLTRDHVRSIIRESSLATPDYVAQGNDNA